MELDGHAASRSTTATAAYYELFVWRDGKPGYPCVGFKMQHGHDDACASRCRTS